MRKLFYLLLVLPLFMASCSDDDSGDTEEYENIGTVAGTWAFQSVAANIEASGTLAPAAIIALNPVLQTYAGSQEPSYYTFNEDLTFQTHDLNEDQTGYGTYTLSGNTLVLTYPETSSTETFEIVVANETSLKVRKDYSNSVAYWGANALGAFAGVSVTKAMATLHYSKM